MATDEQINDAIQAYLTERAYGGLETDGLAIAAAAGWEMMRAEVATLRGRVAALEAAARAVADEEFFALLNTNSVGSTCVVCDAVATIAWDYDPDGGRYMDTEFCKIDHEPNCFVGMARALVAGMEGWSE